MQSRRSPGLPSSVGGQVVFFSAFSAAFKRRSIDYISELIITIFHNIWSLYKNEVHKGGQGYAGEN